MEPELPVQLLPTGVLRAALQEVLAADTNIRVVEAEARVIITHSSASWKSPLDSQEGAAPVPNPAGVVFLTTLRDPSLIEAALLGVQVFVDLDDPAEDLLTAVRRAAAHQAFCSTSLHAAIVQALRGRLGRNLLDAAGEFPGGLTEREQEVARLAAMRMSRQEIARELCVSLATVKTHLANARRKVGYRRNGRAV